MSDKEADTVNDRDKPDICLQHLSALLLVDGALTFETFADAIRMSDPAVRELPFSDHAHCRSGVAPAKTRWVCVKLAERPHSNTPPRRCAARPKIDVTRRGGGEGAWSDRSRPSAVHLRRH